MELQFDVPIVVVELELMKRLPALLTFDCNGGSVIMDVNSTSKEEERI